MSARAGERPRPGRPRRRGPWRDLFDDPVRKLAALALATLLWLFLDSQITERDERQFKLSGEHHSTEIEESEVRDSYVMVEPPPGYRVIGFRDHLTNAELDVVRVVFKAAQHQLRNALQSPGLFVKPRQADISQKTSTVMFESGDLQAADPVVIKAIHDMSPRRIDVLLERVDEKRLALDKSVLRVIYPDTKIAPDFAERLRLDAAVFTPQQVTLRAPRSLINDVANAAPLFTLDLSQQGSTMEPKVVAALVPIAIDNLTIDGGPVTISVPLDPQYEACELTVPVVVHPSGRAEHEPTLRVTLRVSGELAGLLSRLKTPEARNAWASENAHVYVRLPPDWSNETKLLFGTFNLNDPHYERGRHYRTEGALSVQVKAKRE